MQALCLFIEFMVVMEDNVVKRIPDEDHTRLDMKF